RRLDILPRLRRAEEALGLERLREIFEHLRHLPPGGCEVHLVSDENGLDRPRDFREVGKPVFFEARDRLRARDVVDEEGALRALERALLDPFVTLLPKDIPNHERQVGRPTGGLEPEVLFRHLRADRRDVLVGELVHDEPADQAGLPDRAVAEEQYLSLDTIVDHREVASFGGPAYNASWLNVSRANRGSLGGRRRSRPPTSRAFRWTVGMPRFPLQWRGLGAGRGPIPRAVR